MSDVDVFDGIEDVVQPIVSGDNTPPVDVVAEGEPEPQLPSDDDSSDSSEATSETESAEAENKPVETVSEIPAGAVSVTEFAAYVTAELMRAAFESGGVLKGNEFTVPQDVYQTVRASRDRIPHVFVKDANSKEARVYILKDEAFVWWMARRDRLKDRGTGATRASNRTAEENLVLLAGAVEKALYAKSRLDMWTAKVEQTQKLVDKYKGFLKEQEVAEETVTLAIQEATDEFDTAQKIKADEKAAKAKKSGKTDESDNAIETDTDTSDDNE